MTTHDHIKRTRKLAREALEWEAQPDPYSDEGVALIRQQLERQPPSEEVVEAVARPSLILDIMADLEWTRHYTTVGSFVDSSTQFKRLADFLHAIAAMPSIPQESDAEVTEAMERAATAIQLWWMTQKHEPMHRNDALDLARTAMTSARDRRG